MLRTESETMRSKANQANRADMQRLKMEFPVWFPVLFTPLTRGLCTHISFHVREYKTQILGCPFACQTHL